MKLRMSAFFFCFFLIITLPFTSAINPNLLNIHDIFKNPTNWANHAALMVDVGALFIPFITGAGMAVKFASKADDVVDAGKTINKIEDVKKTKDAKRAFKEPSKLTPSKTNKVGKNPLYTGNDLSKKAYTYLDEKAGEQAIETGTIKYKKQIYGSFDKYSKSDVVHNRLQIPEPNKAFRAEFPTNQFKKENLKIPSANGYLDPYTISNPQWGYGGGSQFIIQEDIANVVVRRLK